MDHGNLSDTDVVKMLASGKLIEVAATKFQMRSSAYRTYSLVCDKNHSYCNFVKCTVCKKLLKHDVHKSGTTHLARHAATHINTVKTNQKDAERKSKLKPSERSQSPFESLGMFVATEQEDSPTKEPAVKPMLTDSNSYMKQLSEELWKFRDFGNFCDTLISTADLELQAHSLILAAASAVFRSAFASSSPDESGKYHISMPSFNGAVMECVLRYMYTGVMNFSVDDKDDVIFTCQQLDIMLYQQEFHSNRDQISVKIEMTTSDDEGGVDEQQHHISREDKAKQKSTKRTAKVSKTSAQPCKLAAIDDSSVSLNSSWCFEEVTDIQSEPNVLSDDCLYVCDICSKGFVSATDLTTHRRSHHGCSQCSSCGLLFNTLNDLFFHLCHQCERVEVKCNICSVPIIGRGCLTSHATDCHPDVAACAVCNQPCSIDLLASHEWLHKTGIRYSDCCSECGKHFMWKRLLRQHLSSEHTSGLPLLSCTACGSTFDDRASLRLHMEKHGLMTAGMLGEKNGAFGRCVQKYVCDECGQTCTSAGLLKKHRRGHSSRRSCICEICGSSFQDNASLRKHIVLHNGNAHFGTFACVQCPKTFTCAVDLQAHARRHIGDFSYFCPECGRQFRKKDTMQRHLRIHTGECPYVCETCGRSFKIAFYLRLHRATHVKERAYQCTVCSKAFQSTHRLKKHMFVHSGLKPYACSICKRMFSRKSNMLIHARQHSENKRQGHLSAGMGDSGERTLPKPPVFFHCAHCGVNFDSKADLKAHVCHGGGAVVTDDSELKSDVEVYYTKNDDNIYLTVPILLQ